MKKILVPVDFSDASGNATVYATAIAKAFDAELILLHALFVAAPVGDLPGYMPLSLTEMIAENESLLKTEIERLAGNTNLKIEGFVRVGMASGIIQDVVTETDAELVVMGMKGAGESSGIFGSTVNAVIRRVGKPVLVIPEKAEFKNLKSVCFAADFGRWPSLDNYSLLANILQKFTAYLTIVHVAKDEETQAAKKVAGKIRADLLFDNLAYSFHTVVNKDIEAGLHTYLAENPVDMLVMVAHHHNLFERLFGTVHTKLMTSQTSLPLLVLHD